MTKDQAIASVLRTWVKDEWPYVAMDQYTAIETAKALTVLTKVTWTERPVTSRKVLELRPNTYIVEPIQAVDWEGLANG